jgi:hypothetical protein
MTKSKTTKGTPRHKEHNAPGGPKNPFGQKSDKAALVAKLAANAKKPEKP